jgi:hypothetical protein
VEKLKNKTTVDELAEMFKLTSWDELDDANFDYYWQSAHEAMAYRDFENDAEREEEMYRVQDSTRDELFANWYNAVMSVADTMFGKLELDLVPVKVKGKVSEFPFEFVIKPRKNWKHSCEEIVNLINGVGYFYFRDVNALLSSGPYTPMQAVLNHLGYVNYYHQIYGSESPSNLYDRAFR